MSMRSNRYERDEPQPRGKCLTCICVSWKVFSYVFSHVTLIALVVLYCVAGGFLFQKLEEDNEKEVRKGIVHIRGNTTKKLWEETMKMDFLKQDEWTKIAIEQLQNFETSLLNEMKEKGWDGIEMDGNNKTQWSFGGALFYSIIVITTIGYGNVVCKTVTGKICTIFYAILGIPLMLLCLSTIGDIMASSFRFIYWRVCCYVCTREPKKNQRRKLMMRRQQLQQQQLALQERAGRYSARTQSSMRRSIRTSQRSADSGIDPYFEAGGGMSHAYSDMDCRYAGLNGGGGGEGRVGGDLYHHQQQQQQQYYEEREKMRGRSLNFPPSRRGLSCDSRYRNGYGRGDGRHTVDRERFPRYNEPPCDYEYEEDIEQQRMPRRERMREREDVRASSPPLREKHMMRYSEDRQMGGSPRYQRAGPSSRVQSLDRRMHRRDPVVIEFEQEQMPQQCKQQPPMFCNKYAVDEEMEERAPRDIRRPPNMRSQSMPRQPSRFGDRLMPPQTNSLSRDNRNAAYNADDTDAEMPVRKGRKASRPVPSPSPRIMSPMGFAIHRQARHLASIMDENSVYGDNWDNGDRPLASQIRPVPIWLCVFLVIGYIIGGGFLFQKWEGWDYLDSVYFCFITLTTIGFGDIVPNDNKDNPELSIALCSIYLLFGIALLAMSFNLVQEEVIAKVKHVARRLGIIKDEEVDD